MNAVVSLSRPRTPPLEVADELEDPQLLVVNKVTPAAATSDTEDDLLLVKR